MTLINGAPDLRVFEGAHGEMTLTRDSEPRPPHTLREQVAEFHKAMGVEGRLTPGVPSDDVVRLRLRLIAEEFLELLEASFDRHEDGYVTSMREAHAWIKSVIDVGRVRVDLPEFADACADLDYLVEGSRHVMGIDGGPIAAEVHRSNIDKCGPDGKVRYRPDGKVLKPEGWAGPDICGCLVKQGWQP